MYLLKLFNEPNKYFQTIEFEFHQSPLGTYSNSTMYGARNLEMSIRFSLKSWPSEQFPRPEMSQIKAEISLPTNVKLNFHKNVGCQ